MMCLNISVCPDLTPQQREESKKLRTELSRRKDEGEEGLVIRRCRIVKNIVLQAPDDDMGSFVPADGAAQVTE